MNEELDDKLMEQYVFQDERKQICFSDEEEAIKWLKEKEKKNRI